MQLGQLMVPADLDLPSPRSLSLIPIISQLEQVLLGWFRSSLHARDQLVSLVQRLLQTISSFKQKREKETGKSSRFHTMLQTEDFYQGNVTALDSLTPEVINGHIHHSLWHCLTFGGGFKEFSFLFFPSCLGSKLSAWEGFN